MPCQYFFRMSNGLEILYKRRFPRVSTLEALVVSNVASSYLDASVASSMPQGIALEDQHVKF